MRPCSQHPLHRQPWLLRLGGLAMVAALYGLPAEDAASAQASTQMSINASVQPYIRLNVTQPDYWRLNISELSSAANGSIHTMIPNPRNPRSTTINIQTNSQKGYTIRFSVVTFMQPYFHSIEIFGLGQAVQIPSTGGAVFISQMSPEITQTLSFKFNLSESTNQLKSKSIRTFVYPWPLSISIDAN